MPAIIELQNIVNSREIPSEIKFQLWVDCALGIVGSEMQQPEVTIRVVSKEESRQLNSEYRQKDKPTNILSFPFEIPEMIPAEEFSEYLGDLVVCEDVLNLEASQQNKTLEAHWAHLVVHGILHLLSFDHIEENEAEEMESLEIKILAELGISNPYIE